MAYKQKGFPVHKTGQVSKAPVKKMSEKGKAVSMGAASGAASGAMACAAAGPWALACSAVGGVLGALSSGKKYEDEQAIIAEQERIDKIAKEEKEASDKKGRELAQLADETRTTQRLPGRTEQINPDGTVTDTTEVGSSAADLERLYSPVSKKGSMKPIKKLKPVDMPSAILKMPARQGNDINAFNAVAMNIANEPTGTDVPFIEDPLIDSPLLHESESEHKHRRYYDFDDPLYQPPTDSTTTDRFVDDSLEEVEERRRITEGIKKKGPLMHPRLRKHEHEKDKKKDIVSATKGAGTTTETTTEGDIQTLFGNF